MAELTADKRVGLMDSIVVVCSEVGWVGTRVDLKVEKRDMKRAAWTEQ